MRIDTWTELSTHQSQHTESRAQDLKMCDLNHNNSERKLETGTANIFCNSIVQLTVGLCWHTVLGTSTTRTWWTRWEIWTYATNRKRSNWSAPHGERQVHAVNTIQKLSCCNLPHVDPNLMIKKLWSQLKKTFHANWFPFLLLSWCSLPCCTVGIYAEAQAVTSSQQEKEKLDVRTSCLGVARLEYSV